MAPPFSSRHHAVKELALDRMNRIYRMEEQFAWQMNLYHWAMAVPVRQSILCILCILSPFRANPAYSGLLRLMAKFFLKRSAESGKDHVLPSLRLFFTQNSPNSRSCEPRETHQNCVCSALPCLVEVVMRSLALVMLGLNHEEDGEIHVCHRCFDVAARVSM
jgi:hypothetical protein